MRESRMKRTRFIKRDVGVAISCGKANEREKKEPRRERGVT